MKLITLCLSFLLSTSAFAYGTGYVTHPLRTGKHILSTEFTGIVSTGGGAGVQARYTRKMAPQLALEAGAGINGGNRDNRFFIGADYELLPDYRKQPRVSTKVTIENASEFDSRRNILALAPTISKGFSFWGKEAFPFISIPVSLNLDGDTKTYESQIAAAIGITGPLPFEDYKHLLANFETSFGLKDSFTAVFLGLSYQLN